MGHIYAICGPSGVGKTTFLNELFLKPQESLSLIVRSTIRSPRPNEKQGIDYNFYTVEQFLKKEFEGKFLHRESYGTDIFGIETELISSALKSDNDGIIMAGVFGAKALKDLFKNQVSIVYLFSGPKENLNTLNFLDSSTPEIQEIRRRLKEKIHDRTVNLKEDENSYLFRRMSFNKFDLAFINSLINQGQHIYVLENLRDKMSDTIAQFNELRECRNGLCRFRVSI